MSTHVTLTDVMVDELVARAEKAEARVAALEAALAWYFDAAPEEVDAIRRRADELQPTEQFLQKVRAL